METIEKFQLLPAMKTILQEYKDLTHRASTDHCKLCELYIYNYCLSCPMKVFGDDDYYPCMARKCEPLSCYSSLKDEPELKAVIEFYEKAIKRVKSMTEEELNKKDAFDFLIKIDKEVAEKYSI
jgi:hypothetical protein